LNIEELVQELKAKGEKEFPVDSLTLGDIMALKEFLDCDFEVIIDSDRRIITIKILK
jgi:hypothetical protein